MSIDTNMLKALEKIIKESNKEILKELNDLKEQNKFYCESFEEFKKDNLYMKNEIKAQKKIN
jgi:hypothetical protein